MYIIYGINGISANHHPIHGKKFYRLPTDPQRHKEWLTNCVKGNFNPDHRDRLCTCIAYHMEPTRLNKDEDIDLTKDWCFSLIYFSEKYPGSDDEILCDKHVKYATLESGKCITIDFEGVKYKGYLVVCNDDLSYIIDNYAGLIENHQKLLRNKELEEIFKPKQMHCNDTDMKMVPHPEQEYSSLKKKYTVLQGEFNYANSVYIELKSAMERIKTIQEIERSSLLPSPRKFIKAPKRPISDDEDEDYDTNNDKENKDFSEPTAYSI